MTDEAAKARISAYTEKAIAIIQRVKERRGIPLHQPIPTGRSKWATSHCGRDGCPCPHGTRRDRCYKGFVPSREDPDEERQAALCPTCRDHARRQAEQKEITA